MKAEYRHDTDLIEIYSLGSVESGACDIHLERRYTSLSILLVARKPRPFNSVQSSVLGIDPKKGRAKREREPCAKKTEARRFYEKQVDECRTVGGTCAANVRTEEGRAASRKCRESDGGNPESAGQYTAERAG